MELYVEWIRQAWADQSQSISRTIDHMVFYLQSRRILFFVHCDCAIEGAYMRKMASLPGSTPLSVAATFGDKAGSKYQLDGSWDPQVLDDCGHVWYRFSNFRSAQVWANTDMQICSGAIQSVWHEQAGNVKKPAESNGLPINSWF